MASRLFSLLSLLLFSNMVASQEVVGSIKQSLNVNNHGTIDYKIPFDVPKPINGFAPKVELAYIDNSYISEVGLGWKVIPKSEISFCNRPDKKNKIIETGDIYSPICLNGTPLILEDGQHLNVGSRYLLRNDFNIRATIIDSSRQPSVPNEIRIDFPNGKKDFYSRGPGKTLFIERSIDAFNNEIRYFWGVPGCETCLSKIIYGNKSGQNNNVYKVTFEYQESELSPYVKFGGGIKQTSVKLNKVKFSYDDIDVYMYNLHFDLIRSDNNEVLQENLTSIKKCSSNNDCMGEKKFDYSSYYTASENSNTLKNKVGFNEVGDIYDFNFYDLDNDGDMDLTTIGKDHLLTIFTNVNGEYSRTVTKNLSLINQDLNNVDHYSLNFSDINSDHKKDIVLISNIGVFSLRNETKDVDYITINDPKFIYDRQIKCIHSYSIGNCDKIGKIYLSSQVMLGDTDGDGIDELIEIFPYGEPSHHEDYFKRIANKIGISNYETEFITKRNTSWNDISITSGLDSDYTKYQLSPYFINVFNLAHKRNVDKFLTYDMGANATGAINNRTGKYGAISTRLTLSPEVCSSRKSNARNINSFHVSEPRKKYSVSNGGNYGFEFPFYHYIENPCSEEGFLADINGDGLLDGITISNEDINLHLNSSASLVERSLSSRKFYKGFNYGNIVDNSNREVKSLYDTERYEEPITFADMNGDGLVDLLQFKRDGVYFYANNGAQFLSPVLISKNFGSSNGYEGVYKLQSKNVAWDRYGDSISRSISMNKNAPLRKLIDVDGNGTIDIVGYNSDGLNVEYRKHPTFYLNKITDQYNHVTLIEKSSNVYQGITFDKNKAFKKHHNFDWPKKEFVKNIKETKANGTLVKSYKYSDYIYDTYNNRSLGFLNVTEVTSDGIDSKKKVSSYYLEGVFNGREKKNRYYINDGIIGEEFFDYSVIEYEGDIDPFGGKFTGGINKIFYGLYDLYKVVLKKKVSNIDGFYESYSALEFNNNGTPLYYQECLKDKGCRYVRQSVGSDLYHWIIDRVESVSFEFDGSNLSSENIYSYNDNPINPDSVISHVDGDINSKKSFEYDLYGLLFKVRVSDSNNKDIFVHSIDRTIGHCGNYENSYYSVKSTTDSVTVKTECFDIFGNIIEEKNISGGVNQYRYDPLGVNIQRKTYFHEDFKNDITLDEYTYSYDIDGDFRNVKSTKISNHSPNERITIDYNGDWIRKEQQLVGEDNWAILKREYDIWGNLISETKPSLRDSDEIWTKYTYDRKFKLSNINRPSGNNLNFNYRGLSTTISDVYGNSKVIEYDKYGRIRQINNALNDIVSYEYTPWFGVKKIATSHDLNLHFAYDGLGRVRETADPYIGIIKKKYDALGRLLKEEYDNGDFVERDYDSLGRPITISSNNSIRRLIYDENGYLGRLTSSEALEGTTSYKESIQYKGELKSKVIHEYDLGIVEPHLDTIEYQYFSNGQLSEVKYKNGSSLFYEYDNSHRYRTYISGVNNTSSVDTRLIRRVYLDLSRRFSSLNREKSRCAKSLRVKEAALKKNRVLVNPINFSRSNNKPISFTNILDGLNIDSSGSLLDFGSDILHESQKPGYMCKDIYSVEERLSEFPLNYLNLSKDLLTKLGEPTPEYISDIAPSIPSEVSLQYLDTANKYLSNIKPEKKLIYEILEQDQISSASKIIFGNLLVQETKRNAKNLLLEKSMLFGASETLQNVDYIYNELDLLEEKNDHVRGRTETYTYDELYRLDGYSVYDDKNYINYYNDYTLNFNDYWNYDELGNILSTSEDNYTYGDKYSSTVNGNLISGYWKHTRLLESINGSDVDYDQRGRITRQGGKVYGWDGFGQSKYIKNGSRSVHFTYKADGSKSTRLDKLANEGRLFTYYLSDGAERNISIVDNKLLSELKINIYAGQRLIASSKFKEDMNSSIQFYSFDNINSTSVETDNNGKLARHSIYEPFGNRHTFEAGDNKPSIRIIDNEKSKLNNIGYTGHEDIQDLNIIHMKGRIYDPVLRRFLSPDPYIGSIYSDQNLNRYSYVINNPLSYNDPSGHFLWTAVGAAITAYDMYAAYQDGGWSSVAQVAATDLMINMATGGAASIARKGVTLSASFVKKSDSFTIKGIVDKKTATGDVTDNASTKSPCPLSCFVAGTEVLTPNGYQDIVSLQVGDLVWAKDVDSGVSGWKAITHTWVVEDKAIYRVTIETENGKQQTIDATESHPFYVAGKGWVDTVDLVEGDQFEDDKQRALRVVSIDNLNKKDTAYNFTVADYHTYYVTTQNVLVHNCGGDVTNKTGKKYVTYTADDLDNPGKIYTGRCSGTCDMTPQQILDKRKAGHHRNLGDLQLDQVTDSYPAIRGREQQVLESLREQGLATDQINGVGPRNKRKDLYMEAAKKTFGE